MVGQREQRGWGYIIRLMNYLLTFALTVLICFHDVTGEETEGSGTIVSGSVILNDDMIFVQPIGSDFTEVKITGVLNSDIDWTPNTQYVMAEIFLDNTSWNYTVPGPLNMKSPQPRPFTIKVQIPYSERGNSRRTITVGARWTDHPSGRTGNYTPDDISIYIRPYYYLELKYQDKIRIKAGHEGKIWFDAINLGNTPDFPSFHILNIKNLTEKGWKLEFPQNQWLLSPGRNDNQTLYIEIPFNARSGNYHVEIEFGTIRGEAFGEVLEPFETYILEIEVDGKLYFDIGPKYIVTGSFLSLLPIISIAVVIVLRRLRKKGNINRKG